MLVYAFNARDRRLNNDVAILVVAPAVRERGGACKGRLLPPDRAEQINNRGGEGHPRHGFVASADIKTCAHAVWSGDWPIEKHVFGVDVIDLGLVLVIVIRQRCGRSGELTV